MGRTLKRVPLDFDWPLGKVWYGYFSSFCHDEYSEGGCESCKKFAKVKGLPTLKHGCPDFDELNGPPKGEGFQLWGTTSEGEPRSPVFKTLDELCDWCAENDTVFANIKATKEEWKEMLQADFVCAKQGNAIFF